MSKLRLTKEQLIYIYMDYAVVNGYDMDKDEARHDINDMLASMGAPVAYFKTAEPQPHTFHWMAVGDTEVREYRRDESKVEISKEEFDKAIEMFELGLD